MHAARQASRKTKLLYAEPLSLSTRWTRTPRLAKNALARPRKPAASRPLRVGRNSLKGQAAGHVDGDMQMTPAHPPMRVRHGLAGPAAAPFDAAEALDVDADELAGPQRRVRPEAARRLGEEVAQSLRAVAAQDAMHGARVQPQDRGDPVRTDLVIDAHGQHTRLERIFRASRRAMWPA